ncbi:cell division FtsA domain-containing protein [Patescibacteria group bacterium]
MKLIKRLLSGSQDLNEYILALDVGTSFVKALIVRLDFEHLKGYVVGVGRHAQSLGDMQSGAVSDIGRVVINSQAAIDDAVKMAGVRPDQAIIGIAGELVKGTTTTAHYKRNKPDAKIDLPELKNILHKVQWKAFDQVRKDLSWETGMSEIDIKLINAAIVDVKIDGYRVTNPIGFQGKDVEIGIFNAYAPLVHLGALQTIADELGLDLLSIAAEPYAVARSTGLEDAQEFSAIFIDIGGGTTDIAVVSNGVILGTKMFGLGGRAFTKRIASALNTTFEEAEEIKLKYSNNKLDDNSEKKVSEIVVADAEVWLSGVELALSEFDQVELLPNKILLAGGGSKLPEIKKVLKNKTWYKNLPFSKAPNVSSMRIDNVVNIIDETGMLKDAQEITPLGLANLALDIAGEESITSNILRKVVKLMQT